MATSFPDHPFLTGNHAPVRAEVDAPDLQIEAGPVAVAHLDTRVPNGFHGSWAPASS